MHLTVILWDVLVVDTFPSSHDALFFLKIGAFSFLTQMRAPLFTEKVVIYVTGEEVLVVSA